MSEAPAACAGRSTITNSRIPVPDLSISEPGTGLQLQALLKQSQAMQHLLQVAVADLQSSRRHTERSCGAEPTVSQGVAVADTAGYSQCDPVVGSVGRNRAVGTVHAQVAAEGAVGYGNVTEVGQGEGTVCGGTDSVATNELVADGRPAAVGLLQPELLKGFAELQKEIQQLKQELCIARAYERVQDVEWHGTCERLQRERQELLQMWAEVCSGRCLAAAVAGASPTRDHQK